MRCPDCGHDLPEGAASCTHCATLRRLAGLQATNGALKGGAAGLAVGLLAVTVMLAREIDVLPLWALLSLPVFLFVLGALVGYRRARTSSGK